MCDYSLHALPNRLAVEGEPLLLHRFPTGALGLASPSDLWTPAEPPGQARTGWWSRVKRWLSLRNYLKTLNNHNMLWLRFLTQGAASSRLKGVSSLH